MDEFCCFCAQGLAFTLEERQALGIHGLMPPCFKNQAQQIEVCRFSVMKYQEDLNRFLYLSELQVGTCTARIVGFRVSAGNMFGFFFAGRIVTKGCSSDCCPRTWNC